MDTRERDYDGNSKLLELERNCEYAQRIFPGNLVSIETAVKEVNGKKTNVNTVTFKYEPLLANINSNLIFFETDDDNEIKAIQEAVKLKQGKQLFDKEIYVENKLTRVLGFGLSA